MVFCTMHSLFLKEKIRCRHTNLSVSFFYYNRKVKITHQCFVLYHFVTITMSCRLRACIFVVAESFICKFKRTSFLKASYIGIHSISYELFIKMVCQHTNQLIFIFYLQAKYASLSNGFLCMVSFYQLIFIYYVTSEVCITKQLFALNSFVVFKSTHYTLQAVWTYGE